MVRSIINGNFQRNSYFQNGSYYPITNFSGWSFTNSTGGYSADGTTFFGVNTAVNSVDLTNTTNWPDFTTGNNVRVGGYTAPDGSSTAVHIAPTSLNSGHHLVYQSTSLGSTTTFSIYAKAAELNYLVFSGYAYNYVSINLTTGVITDGASGLTNFTATYIGNGWWRCSATGTGTWGGQFQFGAGIDNSNNGFTGDGTSGILVWGPQFESGSVPTPYGPTTATSGATSAPRITASGLLVESSATNLLPYSTPSSTNGWYGYGGATATSGYPDPSGGATGVFVTLPSTSAWEYGNLTLTSGTTYVISGYVKTLSSTQIVRIDLFDGTTYTDHVSADLTVTTSWQRISVSWTPSVNSPYGTFALINGTAGAAANVILAFAQMEVGSTPTSYIPTNGATVTRTADSANLTYSGTATNVAVTTPGLGAMVYPTSGVTNYQPNSTNILGTGWGAFNSVTATSSSIPAPDGTLTAVQLAFPGGNGQNTEWYYGAGSSLPNATVVTMSCWMRSISGTTGASFDLQNAGDYFSPDFTLTTTWQRYTWTTTTTEAGLMFAWAPASNGNATTYLVWGPQLEVGSLANGYVPTTSSAVTLTPSSPVALSQAPFLNQNITTFSVNSTGSTIRLTNTGTVQGAQSTFVTFDEFSLSNIDHSIFTNNTYIATGTNYTISTLPGFSFTNTTGGYSLDGSTSFAANVPRIEPNVGLLVEGSATNLAHYSCDGVNAAGAGGGAALSSPQTATTGQADPTGGTGAILVGGTGTSSQQGWNWCSATIPYVNATTYTWSIFVKYSGLQFIQFTPPQAAVSTQPYANFDLINGVCTSYSGSPGTITNVGNGWFRISLTATTTAGTSANSGFLALITSGTATRAPTLNIPTNQGVYIWGWQIEVGQAATSIIATGGSGGSRSADVVTQTYNSTASSVVVTTSGLGAITYPAAGVKNYFYPSASAYTSSPGPQQFTYNVGPAPDGSYTATSLGGQNGVAGNFANFTVNPTGISSTSWTFSVFVKYVNIQYVTFSCESDSSEISAAYYVFDIINGTYNFDGYGGSVTSSVASITLAGNGWWRISVSATFPASYSQPYSEVGFTNNPYHGVNFNGYGLSILLWGAQCEPGITVNGYVPTTTAAVTFTPTSPFTISQAPFLGQNIQSLVITGTSPIRMAPNTVYANQLDEVTRPVTAMRYTSSGTIQVGSIFDEINIPN